MSAREGREWVIDLQEYDSEEDFRVAVAEELARLENMGHRLGRAFVVTPIRRKRVYGNTTVYETQGWVFSEQFMPAAREVEPDLAVDELPELEPVEA